MIVTGIFLLFAAVPLACVEEVSEGASKSNQCSEVTSRSFPSCGFQQNFQITLGMFCSLKHTNENMRGQWIGYSDKGMRDCRVCCAHKDEHGNITYSSTISPNGIPCGDGKVCKAGKCST